MTSAGSSKWQVEAFPLLLTLTGAGVDAMVILGLNVLTAAQTGNTILLAVAIARGDAVTGLNAAVSVGAFIIGCFLGEFALRVCKGIDRRGDGVLLLLLVEVVLLTLLLLLWRRGEPATGYYAVTVVSLAAFTMGLQSAIVLYVQGPSTTYMTGMVATFGTGLVRWLSLGLRRARHDEPVSGEVHQPSGFPWRNGGGWLIYLVGAILSGLLFLQLGALAMLMPIGTAIVAIGLRKWALA